MSSAGNRPRPRPRPQRPPARAGARNETAKALSKRLIDAVAARNARKAVTQGRVVAAAGARYAPLALSAYGVADVTTERSVRDIAAGAATGAVRPPLGADSLFIRLLKAMATAVQASTAEFLLKAMEAAEVRLLDTTAGARKSAACSARR